MSPVFDTRMMRYPADRYLPAGPRAPRRAFWSRLRSALERRPRRVPALPAAPLGTA